MREILIIISIMLITIALLFLGVYKIEKNSYFENVEPINLRNILK